MIPQIFWPGDAIDVDAIRVSSKKSWRLAVEFLSQAVQDGQQLEPWQRVEWMQLWKPKISMKGS